MRYPENDLIKREPAMHDMQYEEISTALDKDMRERLSRGCDAAVLVPLLHTSRGLEVLFEVRSNTLEVQPGEVCFPGGALEAGESALQAAVRETCEELLIDAGQIRVLGDLGLVGGLGDYRVRAFVGALDEYTGTFSTDEVQDVHTVELAWFMDHAPAVYKTNLVADAPDDFPWHLVPGGKGYRFRPQVRETCFYLESNPLIWGFTARVMATLTDVLKSSS